MGNAQIGLSFAIDEEPPPTKKPLTKRERFERFHGDHPEIYVEFLRVVREEKSRAQGARRGRVLFGSGCARISTSVDLAEKVTSSTTTTSPTTRRWPWSASQICEATSRSDDRKGCAARKQLPAKTSAGGLRVRTAPTGRHWAAVTASDGVPQRRPPAGSDQLGLAFCRDQRAALLKFSPCAPRGLRRHRRAGPGPPKPEAFVGTRCAPSGSNCGGTSRLRSLPATSSSSTITSCPTTPAWSWSENPTCAASSRPES